MTPSLSELPTRLMPELPGAAGASAAARAELPCMNSTLRCLPTFSAHGYVQLARLVRMCAGRGRHHGEQQCREQPCGC